MTSDNRDYHLNLRIRLAIRAALLRNVTRQGYRSMMLRRLYWCPEEAFNRIVTELIAEGCLTEKLGLRGKPILQWHEEGDQVPAS